MHNEEAGVSRCAETVMGILPKLKVPASLIVVDDGSTDSTPKILAQLKTKWPNKLLIVTHEVNQGYGAGLATGVKKADEASFSHTVFMDSDLTNNPKDLVKFVTKMDYDLVKASRYITGGRVKGVPWKRRVFSQTGNLLSRICFRMGIHDYTNGFRMVRTKMLSGYTYREKGFAIILEEMYYLKKKRAHCAEIPVRLTSRTKTASHFRYTPAQIWAYLRYALLALAA
ncbi:hypothetical protein A2W24_05545 [Microgenomates group bacterium RBG_16_45_19]|nr:MAG: hypothetical protein A2W24_05545 [Microgenomates group bacterium RBG_16_45_19]